MGGCFNGNVHDVVILKVKVVMMTDIMKYSLNRYSVEMVKPERCIRRRGPLFGHIEAWICDNCFLCSGDNCVYEIIDVEYASGSYNDNYGDTWNFEQFCCPNCGEMISQVSSRIISWTGHHPDITCKHCKMEFVGLKDDCQKEILTLGMAPHGKK